MLKPSPISILFVFLFVLAGHLGLSSQAFAQATFTSNASGNWNSTGTWTFTGSDADSIPDADDTVQIDFNHTVTITAAASCQGLTFLSNAGSSNLDHNSGIALTVGSSGVTINGASTGNSTKNWNIGAGSAVVNGDVALNGGTNNQRRVRITISTGSLDINGNLSLSAVSAVRAEIDMSGGSGMLNLSGDFTATSGTLTPGTTSTFVYDGTTAQAVGGGGSINYNDLTVNKSVGTATLSANTTANGALNISAGELSTSTFTFDVGGNLDVDGTLSGTGAVTLSGTGSTIDGTGSITNTANLNITGGSKTILATANLTKSSGALDIGNNITVTNNGTMTLASVTGGNNNSTWLNASASVLNVSGALLATGTLTATAVPNTVSYNGAGAQTVMATNYHHLTLINGGTKTFASGTNGIAGTFTVSGATADATTNSTTINYNGSSAQDVAVIDYHHLTLSNAGTKTFGSGTTKIAGDFTISGSATADATTNSSTIAYNGMSAQNTPALTYSNITLNNASGISLSGDATVDGTLTFTTGNITTGGNKTSLSSTGNVSRTSGHVVGNFEKSIPTGASLKTFEVGDASSYVPIDVSFANVSTAGNLTASTTAGDHPDIANSGIDGEKSVDRYWSMTNSGIVFTSYDATFNFVAGDIDPPANASNFIVGKKDGATWTLPTVGTKTDTSTLATGMTSFSDFQVGEQLSIAFNETSSSGDESVTPANISVSLSDSSGQTVTVDYSVTAGTATGSGTDYTLADGTMNFAPGETTKNIAIAVVDDALNELDEAIEVTLSNPTNAGLGGNAVHIYTINDNDAPPSVAFDAASSSGDESVDPASLPVSLSAISGQTVTVTYAVTGGTATGGGIDYTLADGTLSYAAGETTKNVAITIVNDASDEADETITVTLSDPTNATLGTDSVHTHTINDDDAPPSVAFDAASSSGDESVDPANLSVSLNSASSLTIMVDYAVTGGSATGGGTDYLLANGTLTFTPGETTNNIEITVDDDALDESDETIEVTLSNPSNATLGGTTVHTYTIIDNDVIPSVAFTDAAQVGAENVGTMTITAELTDASSLDVTVPFTVSGTASDPSDYTITSSPMTIPAGTLMNTITITVVDDALDEVDETVIVTMGMPANATKGATDVHTASTTDNDPPPSVAFDFTSSSGDESVTPANLAVSLSSASGKTVTVDYAVTGGTATGGGTDYTLVNGMLSFAEGETIMNIAITVVDDALDEASETIEVAISNLSNATLGTDSVHTYTITDNDAPPAVAFDMTSSSGDEPVTPANVAILLSSASGMTVTVNYAVTGGTATGGGVDYTLSSGTISFAVGESAKNISITVVDDGLDEVDETIEVTLSNPTNATLGVNSVHTFTVLDDDAQPAVVFTTQPGNGPGGEPLSTPPVVEVQDANGNTVTTSNASITMAIGTNPSGGTLSGITTVAAVNGVAAFTDMSIDKAGNGYTLVASSPGLTSATSNPFAIIVGPPALISLASGNGQSGVINSALATPFIIAITDAGGNAVSGQSVTFAIASVPSGATGQTLSAAVETTDSSGNASTVLTLGNKVGIYTVTASVVGLSPVTFTATAIAGGPATIALSSGNNQTATINTTLADALVVTVTDSGGNAVASVNVTFAILSVPSGATGQTLSVTGATTDSSGNASAELTLGNKVGVYTVMASSAGLAGSPVTLEATAIAGSPTVILLISGNDQSAVVDTTLTEPFLVAVTDAGSNPVHSAGVTFAIASTPSGATGQRLSDEDATTDANGQTSTVLTLGDKIGEYTVTANLTGLAANTVIFSATATVPVYPETLSVGTAINFPLRPESDASAYSPTDYRIVGLPGAVDRPVNEFVSGEQGPDWRVFWDNGVSSNDPDEYLIEFDAASPFLFSAGKAYWLLNRGPWNVSTTVRSTPLETSQAVLIPLHPGWNLITNPFDLPIEWAKIQAVNGIFEPIHSYDGSFTTSSSFDPYGGYYFFNGSNRASLEVPFNSIFTADLISGKVDSTGWRVSVELSSTKFTDKETWFGVSDGASVALDSHDFRKPRSVARAPTVYFHRPDWDDAYSSFATDIRPGLENEETWEFVVRAAQGKPSQLAFTGIERIPTQFEIYLIDESRAKYINLREDSVYSFTAVTDVSKLELLVGKEDVLRNRLNSLLPQDFSLGHNFPNPFNPSTTIPVAIPSASEITLTIYNILGQEVKKLYSGTLEAGRHWFHWHGRSEAGSGVSSGVYFSRLTTTTGINLTNRMILLK